MNLTDEDIHLLAKAIAPLLIEQVKATHHEFWIDPEKHYRDHLAINRFNLIFTDDLIAALKEVAGSYRKGRNLVWGIFIALVAAGALWTAFQGWVHGK
ncbi:MAG: hypothetical protein NUV74_05360 [Candidatus Brocadiaceae bacterium]|nr:hypothetical protein [Candidatus Brocadiaceae bacterium]